LRRGTLIFPLPTRKSAPEHPGLRKCYYDRLQSVPPAEAAVQPFCPDAAASAPKYE